MTSSTPSFSLRPFEALESPMVIDYEVAQVRGALEDVMPSNIEI